MQKHDFPLGGFSSERQQSWLIENFVHSAELPLLLSYFATLDKVLHHACLAPTVPVTKTWDVKSY